MNASVVSILTADHTGELEALRAENAQLRREVNDLSGAQADAQEFWARVQQLEAKVRRLEGDS